MKLPELIKIDTRRNIIKNIMYEQRLFHAPFLILQESLLPPAIGIFVFIKLLICHTSDIWGPLGGQLTFIQ